MLYELNLSRIKKQLQMLRVCHSIISDLTKETTTKIESFALARAAHLAVECMIDVGNTIIDGFIMRDPGGYIDIVDILEDEQVIHPQTGSILKKWVLLRDRLVRHYTEVQPSEFVFLIEEREKMVEFEQQVLAFLQAEREKGNIE